MKLRLIITFLTLILFYSCNNDDYSNDDLLYSNGYEVASDLADYELNTGHIEITEDESANNTNGCLNIFGWCGTPNLFKEIGPFDVDYNVKMQAWIKTQYGAAIHLNLKSKPSEYVRIETLEELSEARKWNFYDSEELLVPKGESLMLYLDASNATQGHTYIDELNIYGKPK